MGKLRLIVRFYRELFLANFLVTLSCLFLVWFFGKSAHLIMAALFWFKEVAILMIFYLAVHYKKGELYYYQNLGVSKSALVLATFLFDNAIFFAMLITFRHRL